jgi:hypothetical protein
MNDGVGALQSFLNSAAITNIATHKGVSPVFYVLEGVKISGVGKLV